MNAENNEQKFRNDLKSKLESFTVGFIHYLETKSISEVMHELFTNLKLELFVWSGKPLNAASGSLNDEIKPMQIGCNRVIEVEGNPQKIKEYIEKREQCTYIFSDDSKVLYNASTELVGEFCVMWGIILDPEKRMSEKIMAEVLLDFLQKCFDSLDYLDTTEISAWKEKEKDFNFDIINAYVKKIFCELSIPSEDVVRKISYQHYEGSEVCASIYFVDEDLCKKLKKQKEKDIVWINEENGCTKDISKNENISSVRKMLETCRSGNVLLVRTEQDNECPIVAVANEKALCDESLRYILEFCGRGEWRLSASEDVILEYREGVYCINKRHFESEISEKVELIDLIEEETKSKFKSVFESLYECPHGALMIIGETGIIEDEVKRLSCLHKGTMIDELDLKKTENLSLVQGLASIDGAVMVDYNGICHGFGIILDGETIIEGDVGRGSRYNSARNYVAWRKVYAAVFSEDKEKGIEVINGKTL